MVFWYLYAKIKGSYKGISIALLFELFTISLMYGLKKRGDNYYVQAHNPQKGKQDEVSLRTKIKKDAETKRNRFLATLKENGSWEAAKEELLGKKIVKAGESPNFEQIKDLYKKFCFQSPKTIRSVTSQTNLGALKRLMARLKVKTVNEINIDNFKFTVANRKTVNGEIRHSKGIFKPAALRFYSNQGVKVLNPFTGLELSGIDSSPYNPLSDAVRKAILTRSRSLPADQCLTIILSLQCGLRKSELDKARLSWLVDCGERFDLRIQPEDDFRPKTKHSERTLPIKKELASEIMEIRSKSNPSSADPYIIAGGGRGMVRKDKTYRAVNSWLKIMGVTNVNPLHSMRKEFTSHVISTHGAAEAFKLAGHSDMNLLMRTYGALIKPPVIDFTA